MLYNPKWKAPTKATPSVAGMIAWLETSPAYRSYSYMNCRGGCLVGLYYEAIGYDWDRDDVPCHSAFEKLDSIACAEPHTFGAALDRARMLLRQ